MKSIELVFTGTEDFDDELDYVLSDDFAYSIYASGTDSLLVITDETSDDFRRYTLGETVKFYWSDDDSRYYFE